MKLKICRHNFGFLPQETQRSAQSRQPRISAGTADRFLTVLGREKHKLYITTYKDFCPNLKLNQ